MGPSPRASSVIEGTFEYQDNSIPYSLLTFSQRKPKEIFPLILALHGSGDSGKSYLQSWQNTASKKGFMVLAPTRIGYTLETNDALLTEIMTQYPVDASRLYLAGVSSGALSARKIMLEDPSKWKGVSFIASPPYEKWMERTDVTKLPPLLYVHGTQDEQFDITFVKKRVDRLGELGASVKLQEYKEGKHEHRTEWTPSILKWFKKNSKN